MYKIKLKPKYDNTYLQGTQFWPSDIRRNVIYQLLSDDQIEWLFENTNGRFYTDNCFIFFERNDDAMAFKLRWS